MSSSRVALCACFTYLATLGPYASAAEYPDKPIRIVTSATGGGGDFAARVIAQGTAASLGQPLVVDNRAGGGIIPAEIVWRAPPDGYTLLVAGSAFWVGALMQKPPYDPVKDFSPITLVNRAPLVLVVHPSVLANSTKELIALAKARPGTLNYSSPATPGGAPHLAAELFKSMAHVNLVRVPYRSSSVEAAALVGGEVQLTFGNGDMVAPHMKSGKLRALAVASIQPSALFPGLPTVASAGLPGFEAAQNSAVFAPAKTPKPVITRLNSDIVRYLKTAEARERYLHAGSEVVASTPEELAAKIHADMMILGKVIREAGISPN